MSSKISFTLTGLLLLALITATILLVAPLAQHQELRQQAAEDATFVTRTGNTLYLNGQPFRFAGADIYWLGLTDSNGVINPPHSRIDNGLSAAHSMHATVIRSFALLSVGSPNATEPTLNNFNENAFDAIDYSIKVARDYGMRYIFPLVDNWHSYDGGKHIYTEWRGISDENQFFYSQKVIQDFKDHISYILNHVNRYTGMAYKDDPTIMAWETGNELYNAPASWTEMIAKYIKSLAPNQLVMDGHALNLMSNTAQLQNPSVDMVSGHYYPISNQSIENDANKARQYNKVYIVGEYDWTGKSGGDSLSSMLSMVKNDTAISGDLYWSLYDNEHTADQYTLHFPGDNADMQSRVQMLIAHAIAMNTADSTTTIDDSIKGIGQNQWNYTGSGWHHCTNCNETNPAVIYYNASQSWDETANDTASLSFIGSQVSFYGVTGPWHGIAAVSIDAQQETPVDFYSPVKTGSVLLWTSARLAYGQHTFTLRVTGTKNTMSTGYFIPIDRIDILT